MLPFIWTCVAVFCQWNVFISAVFNSSRGHAIERQNYLDDLQSGPKRRWYRNGLVVLIHSFCIQRDWDFGQYCYWSLSVYKGPQISLKISYDVRINIIFMCSSVSDVECKRSLFICELQTWTVYCQVTTMVQCKCSNMLTNIHKKGSLVITECIMGTWFQIGKLVR